MQRPLRLGFAVKVMGQADLKSNDARRWQNEPHLRVSLGYLQAIFAYLARQQITMYRMSSDLAPYVTHPDLPQFHAQIRECAGELRELGARAKQQDLRLSFHPSQFIVLNSPDPVLVRKGIADLVAQAEMLDLMELGPEAVLVIHVGGTYNDKVAGRERWIMTYQQLPEAVQRRLVLENDDTRYSAADVLAIHEHTGVPLIFDYQHFWCNNPEKLTLLPTLQRFVASWPDGTRPKIHYSSPRTELRTLTRKNKQTSKQEEVMVPPIWTGHADYLNPFEFITFMRMAQELEFDVMLEAKLKDLAVLRIRRDIERYAPDLAPRFGPEPHAAPDVIEQQAPIL
ncbi:MAG: UV DNA damage repair endonuclease UvsE [Herpetosiphonaceae bacterium]|nr:UV DNA damage repair endonuclease UvsE [Herpetosiphonaceae bacterium]